MKILLAIDSSHTSHVLEMAATRLWPADALFCVISVVDMRHWEGLPQLIEDARQEAESVVKRATDRLTQAGHRAFSEIPVGSPREVITEYAKQWSSDLIMVGSHGHKAMTRFLLGSVAQAVLRTAPCSVEIVRQSLVSQPPWRGTRILLATDGSECSAKAVSSVAHRPWPAASEIRILSVAQLLSPEVPSLVSSFRSPVPNLMDALCQQARTRAQEAVGDARKRLGAVGLTVWDATPSGEPRTVILDEAKAWGADLIFLGSHGRHGLERLRMGSVAESVAVYATCSVEVVR